DRRGCGRGAGWLCDRCRREGGRACVASCPIRRVGAMVSDARGCDLSHSTWRCCRERRTFCMTARLMAVRPRSLTETAEKVKERTDATLAQCEGIGLIRR